MPDSARKPLADLGYPNDAELLDVEGVASVPAAFQRTVQRFAHAIAYRTINDEIRMTWSQLAAEVEYWSAALSAVGVGPDVTVATLMATRPEHLIVDLGIIHLGATATSVYATTPAHDLVGIVTNSRARVLVTQEQFFNQVRGAIVDHGLSLDVVVVYDTENPGAIEGVDVLTVSDLLARRPTDGFDFNASWRAVSGEDICQVIYTSGTTGEPKGVEMSHRATLVAVDAYRVAAPVPPGRRLLSAFPLAHAGERFTTYYLPLVQGYCVTFCPDIRRLGEYYLAVRPAYVFLTPRSLERFRATINKHIALEPDAKYATSMEEAIERGTKIFAAEQAGRQVPAELLTAWEADATVRKELLAVVGLDEVDVAFVGAAPVPLELMTYFLGLGLVVRENWGMTESGATTTLGRLDQPYQVGYCGPAAPGMEVKVAENGELLIRGKAVMRGYRNKPEETARAFDSEGWLHSGDIGVMNELGQVRVIDRIKDLIINSNGKNMSPVKIESLVKNAGTLIGQVVAIGDSKPYVTAIITLDPEGLEVYRANHAIPAETPLDVLAKDPHLVAEVQTQIDKANADLAEVERIRAWTILAEQWIPGSDELTPPMKLKRRSIRAKYSDAIDGLYL